MTRSDTLRAEISRLEAKQAGLQSDVAKHERSASAARAAARKQRDTAAKTRSPTSARSALNSAEAEDKKIVAAETKLAKTRKDMGAVEKAIAAKAASLRSARASESRTAATAQDRADDKRRRTERAHAREIARLSTPAPQLRVIEVRPPQSEMLRVLYLTANPEAEEETVTNPDGSQHEYGTWLRVDREVRQVK